MHFYLSIIILVKSNFCRSILTNFGSRILQKESQKEKIEEEINN